jgi:hypothetical protein
MMNQPGAGWSRDGSTILNKSETDGLDDSMPFVSSSGARLMLGVES